MAQKKGKQTKSKLGMTKSTLPYEIGKAYYIETVTKYYTGFLVSMTDQELVLENAAWIADTGRYADAMNGTGKLGEVEPFPDGTPVIISRGSIVMARPWTLDIPRSQV